MKLLRPSLVRRLTVGFILSNAIAIFLFLLLVMYPFALIEEDEPPGPEIPILLLKHDLRLQPDGLRLRAGAEIFDFAKTHPGTWFVAQADSSRFNFGPVPATVTDRLSRLPGAAFAARYRDLGASGPSGHAVTEEIEVQGRKIVVTAGGVMSNRITFGQFFAYFWQSEIYWVPLFSAIFNLVGGLIAIPIVLRSVRPTARAAADVDPADVSKRLPLEGVVKELRPIVAAFNAALDRLAEAFERRRRFIADVAHELRTPLAVLNMHVEALPERGRKPDLQRSVFRLGQMVGQMLDAERLALAGRQHGRVDLVALAKGAVAEIAPLAVSNGYEIAFSAAADIVEVKGDAHSIARAMTNLLGNAVAHGGSSGTIEVRVGGAGTVDVRDEGPGIPAEASERIFEPFRRERWDKDGCGLGLHLVREIMQAHGGTVRLVSSGPGAVFRMEFPAAAA